MDSKKTIKIGNNFHLLNKELLNIGATYSSLLIMNDNSKIIFSKSSDIDWSEEFTTSGLYKHCYLLKEANKQMAYNNMPFTLLWDLYNPLTDKEHELADIRNHKNIVHGVGFCFRDNEGQKILLNIAGKYSDVNFGAIVLKRRTTVYKSLRQVMIG
ncbi:MAG: hypothetical protein QM652_05150 [Legionella sp.]|uniref:hypothetical protein n=1 Tax=Legionella sp. TaxID=459 RepID=UPI0039E5378A